MADQSSTDVNGADVPIQAAHALSRLTRDGQLSFAEAFRTLVDRGALILIEDAPTDEEPA